MLTTHPTTPRADGFRMPAEFEPHAGCWMLFPYRPDNWRANAAPAQAAFAHVAHTIAQFEPVTVCVPPTTMNQARALLPEVTQNEMPSDDAWMRDTGATFVINDQGQVRGVDWDFNAYGGLYASWENDNLIARRMLEELDFDRYQAPLVMEGGSFHVDGQGTLITTEECLLNRNRNPRLTRAQIEQYLCDYLNIQKIIWLPRGVYNDETSGHVDNLCCFVREGVVALTWTDDQGDPQYEISHQAYECLMQRTDAKGRRLEIHKIQQPSPLYIAENEAAGIQPIEGTKARRAGDRMAASYINFYIADGGVIMPAFGDPQDEIARAQLQALFPDRKVVSVSSREILLGGGNIHCITQQQPQGMK